MRSNKILILISLIIMGILGYFLLIKENVSSLVTPESSTDSALLSPTLSPTPTPIVFKFDSSTDLKFELQTVNPKVKSTDFDKLKTIISSL